ncbi:MAG: type II secretion system protein [Candidatus Saccharimonadaceae bacterium]|nr:type II secretion system protein [Candidatus Saccharimonadaceae bacterium]
MNRRAKPSGFTIIELMLAMAFVSFLLISIAMTVIQIGNIYNRGLTLKEVNQAARTITSELQRNIASGSPFKIDLGTGNLYQDEYPKINSSYVVQINGVDDYGGRLCLGQYSYIWNYGEYIKLNDPAKLNVYSDSSNVIRFIKVYDPNATYCETDSNGDLVNIEITYNPPIGSDNSFMEPIELLDSSDHDLALHSFKITSDYNTATDPKTGQKLYNINFVLGTNEQTAIDWNNSTCKPPNDKDSNLNYCSINEFNISARSGNPLN